MADSRTITLEFAPVPENGPEAMFVFSSPEKICLALTLAELYRLHAFKAGYRDGMNAEEFGPQIAWILQQAEILEATKTTEERARVVFQGEILSMAFTYRKPRSSDLDAIYAPLLNGLDFETAYQVAYERLKPRPTDRPDAEVPKAFRNALEIECLQKIVDHAGIVLSDLWNKPAI